MKNLIFLVIAFSAICCKGPGSDVFVAKVAPLPEGTSIADGLSLSNQGVHLRVLWVNEELIPTTATIFDGAGNPVWNQDFSGLADANWWMLDKTTDSLSANFQYNFNPNDKPGIWKLLVKKEARELLSFSFEVAPPGKDPSAYADVDCFHPDGNVNLSNFYQMSEDELTRLEGPPGFELIPEIRYAIKKRAAKCLAPVYSFESIEEGERWLQKLSGIKVRQSKPVVHERIKQVMPVYEEEFMFVNPEFVDWFSNHMMPAPGNQQLNGIAFETIYDKLFRARVRSLTLVGLYYLSLPNEGLDDQVAYAEMAARKYVNANEERVMERNDYNNISGFLANKYEVACNSWVNATITKDEYGDGPVPFNSIDMGFWLRRGIDGSAFMLWMALREIVKTYDQEWYKTYVEPNWAP